MPPPSPSLRFHPSLALLFLLLLAPHGNAESPVYDLFICANVNRDYVIGSQIETLNGTFQLNPDGTWQHFGVNDTTISALAFDPRDRDRQYTATLNGLFFTHDGGNTWRMANDWTMTEGQDVVLDANAPDTLYLALTDGIAVSYDRGQTLVRKELGLPERGKYTQALAVDRTTVGRVFAATASGIYLTENHAGLWRQVLATPATVNDIEQSPHDPLRWLAVTDNRGAWESTDGGMTWSRIEAIPGEHALYSVAFDPTDSERLAIGSWTYGIWTSEDGGRNWLPRNDGLPSPQRVWTVGVHPQTGRLYASVHGATVFFSDDFGQSWQPDPTLEDGSLIKKFLYLPRP